MTPQAYHRAAIRARLLRSGHRPAGPGSISWQINREIVVVAGWGRAILLQLAHPSVAAGVHHHSGFRGSLASGMRRLQSTIGAMLRITFGETDQIIDAAAGINAVHDHVRSNGENGDRYAAHDPELQRWVHATLLDSIPRTYELLIGPLTRRERDRYVMEAAIMEPLMGMPADWLPRDSDTLDAYLRDTLDAGTLIVTDRSRALARAVLYPPTWQAMWPAFRATQLITIGLLPPQIREAYGFTWGRREERALARWVAVIRGARHVLPAFAREWPMARRRATSKTGDVMNEHIG